MEADQVIRLHFHKQEIGDQNKIKPGTPPAI